MYQRYYSIYLLLKQDADTLLEEGLEDIDIVLSNGDKYIYQVKHTTTEKSIGIAKESPLIKTVLSNYDKKFDKIIYSKCGNEKVFTDELKKMLNDKDYFFLGEKVIKAIKSLHNNKKNKEEDNNEDDNEKEDDDKITCCDDHKDVIEFLRDEDNCITFFEKIYDVSIKEFDDLQKKICVLIMEKYPKYFYENQPDYTDIKLQSVICIIMDCLNDKLFDYPKDEKMRITPYNEIYMEIQNTLDKFRNVDDILTEFKNIMLDKKKMNEPFVLVSINSAVKLSKNCDYTYFFVLSLCDCANKIDDVNKKDELQCNIIDLLMYKYHIHIGYFKNYDNRKNFINTISTLANNLGKKDKYEKTFNTHADIMKHILGVSEQEKYLFDEGIIKKTKKEPKKKEVIDI